MHRTPLVAAAGIAIASLAGCNMYDVSATNGSSQDVRISLVKGKKQIHLSDVILAPGRSVEWTGQTNGRLVARVSASPGGVGYTEVHVPRKTDTAITISSLNGELLVTTNLPVAQPEHEPETAAEQEARADAPATEPAPVQNTYVEPEAEPADDRAEEPPLDLIEGDG